MQSLGGDVPFWGYTESVLIDGEQVLCTPGGDEGAVVALDKLTGKVLWQSSELSDAAHYSSIVRADIQGQPQYIKVFEKRLVGLSVADGSLLWEAPFPGRVAVIPTPIVLGNRIFATAGYGAGCMLVDIDPQNKASVVYANRRMKNHHGGVIRLGEYIYGYSDDTGWACLEAATGDLKWRERSALEKGAIGYADGKFYCVGEDEGDVVLIDASPAGWQERGRFTLEPQSTIRKPRGKIWTHPVIVSGNLYLRDQDHLYCYSVKQLNVEATGAGAN
jgi:outer membrane protein assembly factor BamB